MAISSSSSRHKKQFRTKWRSTKVMNMHDLARDDDFLSHLLVEKLGTDNVPLLVHKMDPSRRLPKTNPDDLMAIIRRLVSAKAPPPLLSTTLSTTFLTTRSSGLRLPSVRYFTKGFTERELNSFATSVLPLSSHSPIYRSLSSAPQYSHASRYMELYLPTGSIEIAHTQRYSHRTGKSELCILATRPLAPGTVLSELKGSMADLSEADEQELKRTDRRNSHGARLRQQLRAFREGRYITFRVVKSVGVGEEVTAHYGDGYSARRGRVRPTPPTSDDGRSDESSDVELPDREGNEEPVVNVNERRTRRGVYAVIKESDAEPVEDLDPGDTDSATPGAATPRAIDLVLEVEAPETEPDAVSSGLTSLPPSRASLVPPVPIGGLATPDPDTASTTSSAPRRLPSIKPGEPSTSTSPAPSAARSVTPAFEPIITTRQQKKARALQKTRYRSPKVQALRRIPPAPHHAGRGKAWIPSSLSVCSAGVPHYAEAPQALLRRRYPYPKTKVTEDVARDKGKGKAPAQEETADTDKTNASDPTVPTCVTCLSVLPIISLDRTIVYGDFDNATGKGKKGKRECPRCLRHYAIYGVPWPCRTATQAASVPTPRESTPAEPAPRPNTHKLLHAVGKKLATAPQTSSAPPLTTKRKRATSPPPVTATYKRRKTFGSASLPSHTRELIRKGWSRSGRKHHHPGTKAREVRPAHAQKRPRGRPRLHPLPSLARPSPSASTSAPLSIATASAPPALDFSPSNLSLSPDSRTAKSRAVDDQPREINGRFGKKATTNGKFRRRIAPPPILRRTRAQRAEGRAEAQREAEASASAPAIAEKGAATAVKRERDREYDMDADGVEASPKRSRVLSSASATHLSPLPLPPLLAEGDDPGDESYGTGSDDSYLPVTPENLPDPDPEAEQGGDAGAESEDNEPLMSDAARVRRPLPTLWKPTPFAFAARRWASQESSGARQERDQDRMQFFRAYPSEQTFPFPGPRPAIGRDTGTGTGASARIGNTSTGAGIGARNSSAGGSITRTEWVQVNGTARQFRESDTYEVDSASVSEEEACQCVISRDTGPTSQRGRRYHQRQRCQSSRVTAVEPASSTPSPAPSEEAATVAPLVLLKGTQLGRPGTTSKFASRKRATPPGLVEASWDTELSAEA
ncbi:hypothetical protein EI94DRAFT_1696035 [Lactarius quietus]|nr:hypothetical protein EI94DRAFT_1696035 [Lactarius quietus]